MGTPSRRPSLIERLTRRLLAGDRTDVDFRPPPEPRPDVVAGWERRPRVPGSRN